MYNLDASAKALPIVVLAIILAFPVFPDFQESRDTTMFSTLKPSPLKANPTTREHLKTHAPRVLNILRKYDLFTPAAKSDFVDIWKMDQAVDVEIGSMAG